MNSASTPGFEPSHHMPLSYQFLASVLVLCIRNVSGSFAMKLGLFSRKITASQKKTLDRITSGDTFPSPWDFYNTTLANDNTSFFTVWVDWQVILHHFDSWSMALDAWKFALTNKCVRLLPPVTRAGSVCTHLAWSINRNFWCQRTNRYAIR